MEKKHFATIPLLCLVLIYSCISYDDSLEGIPVEQPTSLHTSYRPVIMKRTVFDTTTIIQKPQKIINSGKIYVKDNLLFINEVNKGFHIFDNSNPEKPVNTAFLKVLGASDLSIKGDVFYINNAVDLITIKQIDINAIQITDRKKNVFPQMLSPDNYRFRDLKKDDIIIDWVKKD